MPSRSSIRPRIMAQLSNYSCLLSSLTSSLTSGLESLPNPATLLPPQESLSLLDTKNELLLSYLQNIVFLIILKLRKNNTQQLPADINTIDPTHDAVIQNLIALRIYLEKGVRPLETRLKYQIDKILLISAEESSRAATGFSKDTPHSKTKKLSRQSDEAQSSGSNSNSDREIDSDSGENNSTNSKPTVKAIPALSHRPNPSSLSRPHPSNSTSTSKSGLYRPPHITPTALPQKKPARARKPNSLHTFLAEEMTDAPLAEPSIGAGSGLRGRAAERELERRGYEEGRLVRLPGEKKKRRRGAAGEEFEGLEGLGEGNAWDGFGKGGKRRRGGGR